MKTKQQNKTESQTGVGRNQQPDRPINNKRSPGIALVLAVFLLLIGLVIQQRSFADTTEKIKAPKKRELASSAEAGGKIQSVSKVDFKQVGPWAPNSKGQTVYGKHY